MRIFLQPPMEGASPDGLAMRACEVLRHSLIMSARPGGIINDRAVGSSSGRSRPTASNRSTEKG
jgi:hypothetical protein